MTQFHTLREGIEHLFAQGLRFVSEAELDALAQTFADGGLSQPAALMRQVRQHVAERDVGAEDAGTLTKILQVLSQAEIQLSRTTTLDPNSLQQLDAYHALYITPEDAAPHEPKALEEIRVMDDRLRREQELIRFLETAPYEELVDSVESVWFDYSLSSAIVKGLAGRGEDALKMAELAFTYKKNLVIQRTAVELLKAIGSREAFRAETLEILLTHGQKAKEPLSWFFEEAFAQLEGRSEEFREACLQRIAEKQQELHDLKAEKKAVRKRAVGALAKTKAPCFAAALIPLLDDPLAEIAEAAMKALLKIGGFEAIPVLAHKVKKESNQSAADVLYKFGDMRGLQYFLERKIHFPLGRLVPLSDYGLLAVAPLLHLIKTLEKPDEFPDGFFQIFSIFRSKKFARKLLAFLEKDSLLAQKFVTLLQAVYPKQCRKMLNAAGSDPGALHSQEIVEMLVTRTLAEEIHKHVATLKQQRLTFTILVTPGGQEVVILGGNGVVNIWNTGNWKLNHSFTLPRKYYSVHQIALSLDGKFFISIDNIEKAVDIWKFGNCEKSVLSLKHPEGICAMGVSADGQYLLAGGLNCIKVWEFETWREVAELSGHSNCVEAIKGVPGKHAVISGDRGGKLLVWDEANWSVIKELKVNGTIQNSIACSPDGRYVAVIETLASYLTTTVKVWETERWQEMAALNVSSRVPISSLAFSADSKYLLCGSNELRVIDVATWEVQLTLANTDARAIAVTPDRKYVIAGGEVWQLDWSEFE